MPTDYDSTHEDDIEGVTVSSKHQTKPRVEDQPTTKKKKIAKPPNSAVLATYQNLGIMNEAVVSDGNSIPMQEDSDDDAVLIPKRNITASSIENSDDDVPLRKKQATSYSSRQPRVDSQALSSKKKGSTQARQLVEGVRYIYRGIMVLRKPWGKKIVDAASLFSVSTNQSEKQFFVYFNLFKAEIADKTFPKVLFESREVFFAKFGRPRTTLSLYGAMVFFISIAEKCVNRDTKIGIKDGIANECDPAEKEELEEMYACYEQKQDELPVLNLTLDGKTTSLCAVSVDDDFYVPLNQTYSALSGVSHVL